jgi:hypothetical protein
MRTWKQGIIGEISIPQSECIYIHCLKYPLGKVYKDYNIESKTLENYLFKVMVDKSALKSIKRIGETKLSKEDKKEGDIFKYESKRNKIYLKDTLGRENRSLENICKTEDIIEKYNNEIKGKEE